MSKIQEICGWLRRKNIWHSKDGTLKSSLRLALGILGVALLILVGVNTYRVLIRGDNRPKTLLELEGWRKCNAVDMELVDFTVQPPAGEEPGRLNLTLDLTEGSEYVESLYVTLEAYDHSLAKYGTLDFSINMTSSPSTLAFISEEFFWSDLGWNCDNRIGGICQADWTGKSIYVSIRNYGVNNDTLASQERLSYRTQECELWIYGIKDEKISKPKRYHDGETARFIGRKAALVLAQ